jgi:hypothetical protein
MRRTEDLKKEHRKIINKRIYYLKKFIKIGAPSILIIVQCKLVSQSFYVWCAKKFFCYLFNKLHIKIVNDSNCFYSNGREIFQH